MTAGYLQHGVFGAMVDRQAHFQLGNRDVPHDSGAGDVERLVVFVHLLVGQMPTVWQRVEFLVIGMCLVQKFLLLFPAHVVDLLHIPSDCARGVHAVPPVGERGIGDQADASEEHEGEEHNHDVEPRAALFLLFCFGCCLFLHKAAARRFRSGAGGRRKE